MNMRLKEIMHKSIRSQIIDVTVVQKRLGRVAFGRSAEKFMGKIVKMIQPKETTQQN